MRINLLSEVTAYPDGRHTDLLDGLQPMHRLFVAALALSPGRPVALERLEDQLWGEFQPADPRGRLYSCASRVRAALRGSGRANVADDHDLLPTLAGGYCLRVDSAEVDIHRFRAKAAEARALADGDDGVASLAREALHEWGSGPTHLYGPEPLAGLPGQWAADYRTTLRREHRDVVIELLGAELRRGRAERALAEFARLADTDAAARDDEQLTALLMHAYYLCGRQSEAFKVYQRTIESLQRKGIEAGRELRMVENKIRNQDPAMDYPHAGVIARRDLVRMGDGDSDDQDGGSSDPDAGAEELEDPSSGPVNHTRGGPIYSQRNIGRTVIANQGTQHVSLGGSDE